MTNDEVCNSIQNINWLEDEQRRLGRLLGFKQVKLPAIGLKARQGSKVSSQGSKGRQLRRRGGFRGAVTCELLEH
jgi:hypothetical protein